MTDLPVDAEARPGRGGARSPLLLVPLVFFLGLTAMFAWGLTSEPSKLPSTLIGRQVPKLNLPPVQGRRLGLSSADLAGEVSLVNVFASWCTACRAEHPVFLAIKRNGTVPVHGLNYKDQPQHAATWLDDLGDPYTRTGADLNGRVAIDWGVYGVPETYVISGDGRVAHRHVGPITQQVMDQTILPIISRLRREKEAAQ